MVEDGRRPSGGADALDPYGCPIHPGVPGSVRSVARSAHIPVERDVCATRSQVQPFIETAQNPGLLDRTPARLTHVRHQSRHHSLVRHLSAKLYERPFIPIGEGTLRRRASCVQFRFLSGGSGRRALRPGTPRTRLRAQPLRAGSRARGRTCDDLYPQ